MEPRGPDGSGLWVDGARRDGPSAAGDHRPQRAAARSRCATRPGLTIVFNGCIYNHHELRARAERARALVRLAQRHRGAAEGLGAVGRGPADATCTGCSPSRCTSRRGRTFLVRDRLGVKPLYLAEVRRRACAPPRRCRRCSRAAGSTRAWTRSRCTTTCRGTRSSPRRGRSCAASRKLPPATLLVHRARRPPPRARLLGPAVRAHARHRRLAGGDARGAAASPSGGGWWPTCRSASCSARRAGLAR